MRLEYGWFFNLIAMANTNQQIEIWKDIAGYEGRYQISSLGQIKILNFRRTGKEKIMKGFIYKDGYKGVSLSIGTTKKTFRVHQLVAMAFLNHTPCGFKLVVNHINFIRTDNRVENLEIIKPRENTNKKHIKSSSEYVGVSWHKIINKWVANIFINGKNKHLGCFKTEIEASDYYQKSLKYYMNGKEVISKKPIYNVESKGVSFHKKNKKFIASIKIQGKKIHLGCFKDEIDASNAYQKALKKKNDEIK